MANISLKRLFEAEDFQAKSKETGKLVHFKSKDSYQAALKAGTHEDPKAQKGGASKGAAKPNDMFGGDYSKDRGSEAPKAGADVSDYKTDGEGKVLYKGKKVADYTYDDITDTFTLNTKDGIEVFDTHNDMYKYLQKNKDNEPKKQGVLSKMANMFTNKDKGSEPKVDSMATVKSIAAKTGLRATAVAGWADENGVNLSNLSADIDSKKLKPMDLMTAISGNPGNKYAKAIIAKYSQGGGSKSTPSEMGVDSLVYNTRTKTVGIVRMGDERGETKTDADGNVNTSELEPYNPMKYPHQKDAKVAPSTQKEVDKRGLYKPFAQDEPVSKAKEARKGNPTVNKEAKKKAEEFGITPQKLGKDGYQKAMYQAAVEALTDSNYHDEARELVASIEGKPEWAKKVDYPSMDDSQYDEKMKVIRTTGVDSSEYWGSEGEAHEFGRKVSQASGWGGVEAADGIAFTLRMNGFHKEADKIQSIFDSKPYMKESSTKLTSMIKK
jgi:hypothetical protein